MQLTRPVKLKKTPFRTRHSLRASIIYKGPVQTTKCPSEELASGGQISGTAPLQESENLVQTQTHAQEPREHGRTFTESKCLFGTCFFCLFVFCITLNTKIKRTVRRTPDVCTVGQCKALYSFTPQRSDELTLKEGTGGGREYCPKSAKSRMEMYKTSVCSQEIYSTFTPRKRMAGGLAHSMARRVIFHPPMWRSCLC